MIGQTIQRGIWRRQGTCIYYRVLGVSMDVNNYQQRMVFYESTKASILKENPNVHLPAGTLWHREEKEFHEKFVFEPHITPSAVVSINKM